MARTVIDLPATLQNSGWPLREETGDIRTFVYRNDFGGAAEISVQIIKQPGVKTRARVRAQDLRSGAWLMSQGFDAGCRWDVLYGAMNDALNIAMKAAGWQFS